MFWRALAVALALPVIAGAMRSAGATDCAADFDFAAPVGHAQRERSVATMRALFMAGAKKDKTAFFAQAADPYVQHSPDLADGIEPVWALLGNRPAGFSNRSIDWIGANGFFSNGDFLVMFREVDRADGTAPSRIFDLARFDGNGKYAEHWDIRQPLTQDNSDPRQSSDSQGAFAAAPVRYDTKQEDANRRLVAAFINLRDNAGQANAARSLYASTDYARAHESKAPGASVCNDLKLILVENDLVWTFAKASVDGVDSAAVNLFRVRDQKIVESWSVIQPVPATMPHDNTMF